MARQDTSYNIDVLQGDLSPKHLDRLTAPVLENLEGWKKAKDKGGISVYVKKDVFGPVTTVRYTSSVESDLDSAERFAFDEMLANMPSWSREFISGEVLHTISDEEQLLKTRFKTPFFMKNREYVFYLTKIRTETTLKVFYLSVDDPGHTAVDKGFVRAKLYPTIYQFTKMREGELRLDHMLTTDLGRDLSLRFQNHPLVVSGMVKANYRDCNQIRSVLS